MNGYFFWKMVKEEVIAQKTSFEWLYRATKIAKGTMASWKNRNVIPRADDAFHIADALGVSVEYLLTGMEPAQHQGDQRLRQIVETIIPFDTYDLDTAQGILQMMGRRYEKR
jgi:transcriptional regulator with XRE-family HTH domain